MISDGPHHRRSSTASRHKGLHDALIAAAEAAVADEGLAKLRARSLAETAGCSVGAIYTVFPDLDALILAVNARTLAAIDTALSGAAPDEPGAHLVHLALAYLDFACTHRLRWAALFQHVMGAGRLAPDWYAVQQSAAFSHIEAPLAALRPGLPVPDCALLARSLFSAVHGMVALGLDEKVATLPLPLLREQIRLVVEAMVRGLRPDPDAAGSRPHC